MAKRLHRALCAAMALCMLTGGASLAEASEAAEADAPVTYEHDGRVTLIDGDVADGPITDFDGAARVVEGALEQLGGDERTRLDPWREITDACGNRYWVFQQICDDTTVLGGAVKVITDGEGRMQGLTSSIVSDLPETGQTEGITAEAAEQRVLEHALRTRQQSLTVVEGLTERMILPVALEIDPEAEDEEGSRYVWVVYTGNPDCSQTRSSDLPYLAHYVTLSGEYLYSLPTLMPADEAGASGFDASYVFEFMEPVDYTGYVDLSSGEELEISVTVMRDKRTGMYYLGNLERRIVVADCWQFLYNGGRVALEYSPDNLEWDQVGLLSLYNYCRAYDYYKAIGWSGGDGLDTPILILNNYCDINRTPVDNAAYVGGYLGWQIFLASQCNDYSQCLDVLGHEYTHCVTGSVMTYNAYMNDYGAINEAISDIQGNTCQRLLEGAESADWEMGDLSGEPIRSLSEPHAFGQPEFTWDMYYVPSVRTPTVLNDEGGVHTNSSLLNYLAWRLYEKGGMTLEEGRSFWFTVDCAMVPGTDYAQLAELLPLALRLAGLGQYDVELRRALDATRLGVTEAPNALDDDRALLTLTLPEGEQFEDDQWILYLFSVDADRLMDAVGEVISSVQAGDYSVLPDFAWELLDSEGEPDELTDEAFEDMEEELLAWARERFEGVFYTASTNAGQDGRTMQMVCLPGYALPLLIHGVYNDNTSEVEEVCLLAYFCDEWMDINALMKDTEQDSEAIDAWMEACGDRLIGAIGSIHGIDDVLDLFFYRIGGGEINELPGSSLEGMEPLVTDGLFGMDELAVDAPQPRKSRPKLNEAADAA